MAAADTARLIAELTLDPRKYNAGLKTATGATQKFESSISKIGSGAGKLSAGLTRAGTLLGGAAIAGLGGAAKAAIDWEEAFTGVSKTVDATAPKLQEISDGLRKMATEMPNSAAELAAIAEAGGAMGIAADDILAFTQQVAILSSTTNVSAEDAATALGQLQNVIGLTGDEFDNFAASLVDLGNKGSSTEAQILEIARRAGGAANLFGIAKDATLGWASAAANLGLNEELAGTALQNILVKLLPKFQSGSKDLQDILGQTGTQIKKSFKEDAGGALEGLIAQLGKLPKDRRLKAVQQLFGKGSGITRLVLGLADSYEKNLAPSLDTATQSWEEATAAQIEFEKRNATVRSAISRLKNGIIDAAITVGEGFAPALGKAATELATFLRSDANQQALKDLGKDIGDAIESIDWKQVLDGARTFMDLLKMSFDWAKRLFDILNALPTQVKAAGLGFLALNKLSGGLVGEGIGSIAGGLAAPVLRNVGAAIPGIGKAFVQPVFVTNWGGMAGAMGGAGAAGGAGMMGKFTKGLSILGGIGVTLAAGIAVLETQQSVSNQSTEQSQGVKDTATVFLGQNPTTQQLQTALAGVEKGISDIKSNPLHVLVAGDALQNLEQTKAAINEKLAAASLEIQRKGEQTVASVDAAKAAQTLSQQETTRETQRGKEAITAAQRSAASTIAVSQAVAAAGIISAIFAARPIISVTNVTRTYNKTTHYGPNSGSRNANAADSNYGPN